MNISWLGLGVINPVQFYYNFWNFIILIICSTIEIGTYSPQLKISLKPNAMLLSWEKLAVWVGEDKRWRLAILVLWGQGRSCSPHIRQWREASARIQQLSPNFVSILSLISHQGPHCPYQTLERGPLWHTTELARISPLSRFDTLSPNLNLNLSQYRYQNI